MGSEVHLNRGWIEENDVVHGVQFQNDGCK
jgi:hypothetical protein